MLFVILFVILALICIILELISGDKKWAALVAGGSLVIVAFIFGGLYMFHMEGDKDAYTDLQYGDNPTEYQELEPLPFSTTSSDVVYVSKEKNSSGNFVYSVCVETEEGYKEKCITAPVFGDVYVKYINVGEQPYFEYQSTYQVRVLKRYPSFWFNFFGWLEYKDIPIGEVCETVTGNFTGNYVLYVPEGSLRENYSTSSQS